MNLISRESSMRAADHLVGAAKRNPEAVLLLAAGCALLMRGVGAAAEAFRNDEPQRRPQSGPNGPRRGVDSRPREPEDTGLADTAREYASDLVDRVKEGAAQVADYADEARHAAYDRSSRMARQTGASVRDMVDRMVNEQPLSLALFGLATGAVLAGALPASRIEKRALAPVRESLDEAARETTTRLKDSAASAGERLGDMAQERGLTAQGLKQAADEVADAFTSELTGGAEDGERAGARPQVSPDQPSSVSSGSSMRSAKPAMPSKPGRSGDKAAGEAGKVRGDIASPPRRPETERGL